MPEKESVEGLPSVPRALREWRRERDRILSEAGHDGLESPAFVAHLKTLAAMADSDDPRLAAMAGKDLEAETGPAIRQVEERVLRVLDRRAALGGESGSSVDDPRYGAWRLDAETVATAGRALLDIVRKASDALGRAFAFLDRLMAEDDGLFARRSADQYAAAWQANWQGLEGEARDAGIAVFDHRRASEALDAARRLLEDGVLAQPRREAILGIVAHHDAREAASTRASAWLETWRQGPEDAAAAIAEAETIIADPALPDILRAGIERDIRRFRHESAIEEAATAASEPVAWPRDEPAVRVDAGVAADEPVLVKRAEESEPTRIADTSAVDDREREIRRERAREAATLALHLSGLVRDRLAGLDGSDHERLARMIGECETVVENPHLAGPERERLVAALDGARERLHLHDRHHAWDDDCRRQATAAASRNRHRLEHDGHARLVATARTLAAHPALSDAARSGVETFLAETERARAERTAFLDLAPRLAAQTRVRRRRTGHETALARGLVAKVRSLVAGPGVTEAEKRDAEAAMAALEVRLQVRPDRGMRWRR